MWNSFDVFSLGKSRGMLTMQKQFKILGMLKLFFNIITSTTSKMTVLKALLWQLMLFQVCIRTAFYKHSKAAGQSSVQLVNLPGAQPLTKPLTGSTVFYFT